MAELNTTFWSCTQEDYPGKYGMKRFTKTLKGMIEGNDLPLNEKWDETISPWAINPRSHPDAFYACDLINKCWLFPDVNRMTGISPTEPPDPDMILRYNFYARKKYYPFMFYCGDGGQGNGWTFPYWKGRTGYDQTLATGDFTNYKENLWIPSSFDYSRLCWLIRVFVSSYGHNNQNLSYWHWGSWYNLADITDELWTDILSGQKDISGVRFVPYYATSEGSPNYRYEQSASGFAAFADGEPLDSSVSAFGAAAPYTEDFIDYMLGCYAAIGTTDSEGARGGYPTLALGNIGMEGSNYWIIGNSSSLADWSETYFNKNNAYQINGTNSVFWKNLVGKLQDSWYSMYYRQYLNVDILTTKELCTKYILSQAAYLGCWFTTKATVATSGVMDKTNPDAYIGIIEADGTTRGRYQQGAEIDTDQEDWINPWDFSPWVPPFDPDPTEWDEDQTSVLETTTGDPSYGTKEYLMTETALVQLLKVLEELKVGEAEGDVVSGYCEKAFGYTDPVKAIVSVIKYPFDMINNWAGSGVVVSGTDQSGLWFSMANAQIAVSIGSGTAPPYTMLIPTAHDIYEITWGDTVWKYGRASLPYFQKFENFLAYEPYCTAALYVPFCGSVRLDPEVYVNHQVGVEYYVSPLDGTCKAYILRDNLVIDTLTGNIGTSIEINSSDELAKANNINLLNSNIQAQKMNLLKQAASFSVGSAINAGLNPTTGAASMVRSAVDLTFSAMQAQNTIDRLEYQIDTTQTPFKQLQPGGGYLSSCDEWGVRLLAYRPEPLIGYSWDDWKEFPTLCGFACLLNDTLDNFTGYTKCATVKLDGIAATAQEKQQIRKLLQSGVYL